MFAMFVLTDYEVKFLGSLKCVLEADKEWRLSASTTSLSVFARSVCLPSPAMSALPALSLHREGQHQPRPSSAPKESNFN
jgi:hypothetical protein